MRARRTNRPDGDGWRTKLYLIIFEADTPVGKLFDVVLLWTILLSVLAVLLESVESIRTEYGVILRALEWIFTVLFTIEYVVRLIAVRSGWRYAVSFFGVVDLLAILPTYLSLYVAGAQSLLVIRGLRLLRVFRVFKLAHFLGEADVLITALRRSREKIIVFIFAVLGLVLVMGALMYLIEGEEHGFSSIPRSIYWAIVTMTTVGYGDIAPQTVLGQSLAAVIMIVGYAIIAVPTGIFTVEIAQAVRRHPMTASELNTLKQEQVTSRDCNRCTRTDHATSANYCYYCGAPLPEPGQ